MRNILETDFEIDLACFFILPENKVVCFLQPPLDKPLLRRQGADFGKIAVEGCRASSRVSGKILHREVFGKMLLHKVDKVNFPCAVFMLPTANSVRL